jgi:hypothetical protein
MTRRDDTGIARAWGDLAAPKVVLGLIAAVYLVTVFAEAAKAGTAAKVLPAPLAYFTQLAALFPRASHGAIDYRAEGWVCRDRKWIEIEPRKWFPIDAENKENRFYRAMYFYHLHRQTMRALDDFIVDHYDADARDQAAAGTGAPPEIGGVRLTRVIVPLGTPGEPEARYARKPLGEYPEDQRKELYWTPESKREERCARIGR